MKRFQEDKKVVVLYLGDHDPPGLHIQRKLEERFNREAHRLGKKVDIEVIRVALTSEQINRYNLPPSPLKKIGQKWEEYENFYGDKVWELDALDPDILVNIVENQIRNLIDQYAWHQRDREVEQYRQLLAELGEILLENLTQHQFFAKKD